MFAMPVDLFGSYTKGREYAIDRNFNDLTQGANIEKQWLNNDLLQAKRDYNLATMQNAIDASDYVTNQAAMGDAIGREAFVGQMYQTQDAVKNAELERQFYVDNPQLLKDATNAKLSGNLWNQIGTGSQQGAVGQVTKAQLPQFKSALESTNTAKYGVASANAKTAVPIAQQTGQNTLNNLNLIGGNIQTAQQLQDPLRQAQAMELRARIAAMQQQLAALNNAGTPTGPVGPVAQPTQSGPYSQQYGVR